MNFKSLKYFLTLVFLTFYIFNQAQPSNKYYFYADLTETTLRNPKIGIEIFKSQNRKSYSIEFSYKIEDKHYRQFLHPGFNGKPSTIPPNYATPVDVVSVFVYNGPTLRISRSKYSKRNKANWYNYRAKGLILKYNWYENAMVNYDDIRFGQYRQYLFHHRNQSERMYSVGGVFEWGRLRKYGNLAISYYINGSVNLRFRNKSVDSEVYIYYTGVSAPITYSNMAPKSENTNNIDVYPSVGIRIGLLK